MQTTERKIDPSHPLDKWTMRGLTYAQRVEARAARAEFLKAEKAAGNKHARTCQICGRAIFAEVGVIAHHGYRRPSQGWQTASCDGARELSFERSRDALGHYIKRGTIALELMEARLLDMTAEAVPFRVEWMTNQHDNRGRSIVDSAMVTRDEWDALISREPLVKRYRPTYSFDDLKSSEVAAQSRAISAMRQHLTDQRARYDGWVQVEETN